MSPVDAPSSKSGLMTAIQKAGAFLAGMVMPNIAAFLAFGIVTALFIDVGWLPSEKFVALVDPMILFLLPILIGYTGGRTVHGQRGAVVGAIATIGVVVGADRPQFLAAMLIGPLSAWLLKQVDHFTEERTKPGFEMLVENLTAGILGSGMAVLGLQFIGPVFTNATEAAGNAVDTLVQNNLLPLAHLLIEPAKILFLNNAINHGVLTPLGIAEAADEGKSIPVSYTHLRAH